MSTGLRTLIAALAGGALIALLTLLSPEPVASPPTGTIRIERPPETPSVASAPPAVETRVEAPGPPVEAPEPEPRRILYLHDIDDIKHEIYQREIESVDRLPLLEDLVQTGDMDTRELWDSNWSGVDDWKRDSNGFTLERLDDGALLFHPDQATMDLYTFFENVQLYQYDEGRHEFVSEVDYYGKPIRNVLKFIKEDTMVMMTISGEKVDLQIYDKSPDR